MDDIQEAIAEAQGPERENNPSEQCAMDANQGQARAAAVTNSEHAAGEGHALGINQ